MPAERLMPTEDGADLIDLTREICAEELAPKAVGRRGGRRSSPATPSALLGKAGLLSLPYPEEFGGGGQPYEVYLQVVEEIASAWMSVAVGVSRALASPATPWRSSGSDAAEGPLLPGMLGGDQLGAYCLSEPQAGSDVASMTDPGHPRGGRRRRTGSRAPRPGSRTPGTPTSTRRSCAPPTTPSQGLSCFVVPARHRRASRSARPSARWACTCDTVRQVQLRRRAGRRRPAGRRAGPGHGRSPCPRSTPDGSGSPLPQRDWRRRRSTSRRRYAKERQQFGRPIGDFQGLAFLLADMEAAVTSARATYLHAARLQATPGGRSRKQAAVAKLVCTDDAMRVTTDAVQVLGGAGYTQDFPARALHARGQGDPDLRGHQPDPAARHRPPAPARLTSPRPRSERTNPCRSTTSTVALVTGGASGLGGATVRRLHADGAAVVIVDLPSSPGAALAEELGERVGFAPADVRDEAQVQAAIDGAPRARRAADRGQLRGRRHRRVGSSASAARWRSTHFRNVIDINLVGTFNVLRLAAAAMLEQRAGRRRPRRHRHDRLASPPSTARSARRRTRRARAASSA